MGKRLIRIPADKLEENINTLLNATISVVLKDQRVVMGTLESFEGDQLSVEIMKGKSVRVPLRHIQEIVYDHIAEY